MQSHDHIEIQQCCLMYYKLLSNICCSQSQFQLVSRVVLNQWSMPFPVIVWHGTKDVLFGFSAKDIIPVLQGNIQTLFLAISGIEICCMYNHLEA